MLPLNNEGGPKKCQKLSCHQKPILVYHTVLNCLLWSLWGVQRRGNLAGRGELLVCFAAPSLSFGLQFEAMTFLALLVVLAEGHARHSFYLRVKASFYLGGNKYG